MPENANIKAALDNLWDVVNEEGYELTQMYGQQQPPDGAVEIVRTHPPGADRAERRPGVRRAGAGRTVMFEPPKTTIPITQPVEPIILNSDQVSFTVDEVIAILDAQVSSMIDDPELTIQQARLAGELLIRIPHWAPLVVEQFAGIKSDLDRFLNRPMTAQLRARLEAHLLTYGHFDDEIHVKADGLTYPIRIGPMFACSRAKDRINLRMAQGFRLVEMQGYALDNRICILVWEKGEPNVP